jgi:hypothetical protein
VRIGLIVDGIGEVRALPQLFSRINTPHELLLRPTKGDVQPKATLARIALAAADACQILEQRRVDLSVILIDLEDRHDCPGALAIELHSPSLTA